MMRRLSYSSNLLSSLESLLQLPEEENIKIEQDVKAIITQVRQYKDAALLELSKKFDQVDATSIQDLTIDKDAMHAAYLALEAPIKKALDSAHVRLLDYHKRQRAISGESWEFEDHLGNRLGQRVSAIDRVGVYVPGGKASYPSSVLMNVVPAKVAGVGHITMMVPTPKQERNPLVLAAAHLTGVDIIYTIGGAQAIAALTYGTQSITAVDKIVGPGNAYVAQAKRQVFGTVGIDMIAGPSEILIIADGSVDVDWIVMDLFSQAEHDETAQSILISSDAIYTEQILARIPELLATMPRRAIIEQSLQKRGLIIDVESNEQACEIANFIAAEHLELAVAQPQNYFPKIRHAGAVFMGAYSSEAFGDYCAGPNHVLPTSRSARFSSALGVYDFQKRTSMVGMSAEGAMILSKVVSTLAQHEGLEAHAQSALLRAKMK